MRLDKIFFVCYSVLLFNNQLGVSHGSMDLSSRGFWGQCFGRHVLRSDAYSSHDCTGTSGGQGGDLVSSRRLHEGLRPGEHEGEEDRVAR